MAKTAREYWDKSLKRKAESTQAEYTRYFDLFLKWAELDAEGLYNLHNSSLNSADRRDSDRVSELLGEYMDLMRDEHGYSNSTQNQLLKSVKSFFDANKVQFDAKPLRRRRISNGVLRVTNERIKEIYMYAMGQGITKFRNRSLYTFLKESGLRVSDASNLDVEDYHCARPVEIRGVPFKVFQPFTTQKTGDLAHVIIGEEAIADMDKYLGDRTTGPIFLDDEGKRWSPRAMSAHFQRARKYALDDKVRVSAHSFRKFHTTILEGNGVPPEWVKLLQGKKAYVYSRPQDGPELLEAYANAYDHLRIFTYNQKEEEIQTLQKTVNALAAKLENVKTGNPELAKVMLDIVSRLEKLEANKE